MGERISWGPKAGDHLIAFREAALHLKSEFIEREKEALDKEIGFIVPLPTIEIVKK